MSSGQRSGPTRRDGLLPPDVLERLGDLELIAATIVRGFISGQHRSPFLGSGEDFSRHRAYQQGDDVRRLDWRLYGRTDRLFVRLFQEDSNLQAFIVVDTSESMGFSGSGTLPKLRYAQFLAAALAHIMLKSGDAVGLASFGDDVRFHLPPRNRPGHLHDLALALERLQAGGRGDASGAISEVGGALRRRGRVILISDCLEDDAHELLASVARLRARGDEVLVVRPITRTELGLHGDGPGRYFDPETPERTLAATPRDDPGFADRVAHYFDGLRRGLEEHGAEYVPMTTDEPPALSLAKWLAARARGESVRV